MADTDIRSSVQLDAETIEEMRPPCECRWHGFADRPPASFITRWAVCNHKANLWFACDGCLPDLSTGSFACGHCGAPYVLLSVERI